MGCVPTVTPYFLAPRLCDFAYRFPDVELRLTEETTPKLVALLQAGKLDLALVGLPRSPLLSGVAGRSGLGGNRHLPPG